MSSNPLNSSSTGVKPFSAVNAVIFGAANIAATKALYTLSAADTPPVRGFTFGSEKLPMNPSGSREYKLEELRFRDYLSKPEDKVQPATDQAVSQQKSSQERGDGASKHLDRRARTRLLEGTSAVEVVVGCAAMQPTQSWSLSRALYSHYSDVLKDTCKHLLHDPQTILRITLPEDDPNVFALFVEYMIHGNYMIPTPPPSTNYPRVSIDAQAWVLGDRLQALQFKNNAMECLYAAHVSGTAAFTPADVHYAYRRSAPESKLRTFYKHLLTALYSQPERAKRDPNGWLSVIKEHEEELANFFMTGLQQEPRMHRLDYYKDVKTVESEKEELTTGSGAIVPAKRKADGKAVKTNPRREIQMCGLVRSIQNSAVG